MLPSPFKSSFAAAIWGLGAAAVLGIACAAGVLLVAAGKGPGSLAVSPASSSFILGRPADARKQSIAIRTTEDGRGLMLQEVDIQAENWPIVTYSLSLPDTLEAVFVWEPGNGNDTVHDKLLPAGGAGALMLQDETDWRGSVRRIGFLIRPGPAAPGSGAGGEHVVEVDLGLSKRRPGAFARAIFTEWSAFRGWTGTSINDLGRAWLPVLLVLWAAAGALLAAAVCRHGRARASGIAVLAGLGTGWLLLHVLWLQQLGNQVDETRQRYGGTDFETALSRGNDHEVVDFTRQVKRVLVGGDRPRRIALVSTHRYFGERKRYLLLPHPVTHFRTPDALRQALPELAPGNGVIAHGDAVEDVGRLLREARLDFRRAVSSPDAVLYLITGIAEDASKQSGES